MGIFSKLFSKQATIDYSSLGTDFHSHLIPGIDDGVPDMDEAIRLIREMNKLGFNRFLTTPHIMPGTYDNDKENIQLGLDAVRKELAYQGLEVTIDAAAEYYFDDYLFDVLARKELITFGNNQFLFELPTFNMHPRTKEFIFEANSAGYRTVLAHVERYTYMHDNLRDYEDLYYMEVGLQINIGSLAGFYGDQLQKVGFKLIEMGIIDYLGSDLHNDRHLVYLQQGLRNKHLVKSLKERSFKNKEL
ncbi:MAG: CpsB/CapC family capsule biosynthesis tyrosine phosphatase [Chitinophagales bacterium]|nr:CpsB/CapC family capsule biosynthesis tyrosine phosphatase [Chitinophagales bacterium]